MKKPYPFFSPGRRLFSALALLAILSLSGMISTPLHAQSNPSAADKEAALLPAPGILRNGISNLHGEGDALWVGPFLNVTKNDGTTWQVANADSLRGFRNRVYSLDAEGETIWVGLGISVRRSTGRQVSDIDMAVGLLVSTDGGETWQYRSYLPPQDNNPATTGILDLPNDSLVTYGVSTLKALPVIVPEQSPPWDIDYDPVRNEVWTANWAAGIRRSRDGGLTWQRIILPPDDLDAINPNEVYTFRVGPRRNRNDTRGQFNHLGFSVLVDETGTVWAGTPDGINRSTDGGLSWRKFKHDGTLGGLTGSWVISIEEQPRPGRNAIWMASWQASEAGDVGTYGVTITRDGGETFEQALVGEQVYDFAFEPGMVYVAGGDAGLLISENEGQTWRSVRTFYDNANPDHRYNPNARVLSVATTNNALWVGTEDGLFRSTDQGKTWRAFRANVPLSPDNLSPAIPAEKVPRVDTYAYPNPFSPAANRFVRIRYDLEQAERVEIQIFDFGMRLVRDLFDASPQSGAREVVWDGTDNQGTRVANGTYFYVVDAGGETFSGKILVLE